MKVLLIPEDFRNDQYILKPIFEGLFRDLGRPFLRVEMCLEPLLGGVGEALKSERLKEIVEQYPTVDIFILCVDRDGKKGRRQGSTRSKGSSKTPSLRRMLGKRLKPGSWREWNCLLIGIGRKSARKSTSRETYFDPYAAERDLSDAPGGGRKKLGQEAARRIGAIRQKCPEDFDCLAQRLEAKV